MSGQLAVLAMTTPHEDAAPQMSAAGSAVDPGDAVFPGLRALLGELEETLETLEGDVFDVEIGRTDRPQRKLQPLDDSRQAEATDRGGKELGRLARGELEATAIRTQQPQTGH